MDSRLGGVGGREGWYQGPRRSLALLWCAWVRVSDPRPNHLESNGTWTFRRSASSLTATVGRCFAPCNPVDKSGRDWECSCRNASGTAPHSGASAPCNIVGRAYLSQRFAGECTDGCHYPNDYWKTAVAERLGGLWYSTPVEAQCNTDASVSCQWRELAKIKVVNASCANANVLRYVEREGEACFAGCTPADRADPTSDCATLCFFETLLGKGANFPNSTSPGLSGTAVVAAFAAAFESDDPAQGGCKDVRSGPEAGISA